MKNFICTLGLITLTLLVSAQTKNHKLGITFGGGSQKYNGDLGNGFTLKNTVWYGAFSLNAGYYLNKSFDCGIFGTMGDYGYCQSESKIKEEIAFNERCPGCVSRVGIGNLSSRMVSGGALIKYKIANGYLFSENTKLKPYVYVGAAINNLTDNMKMNCVNPGNYFSLNAGAGVKYYISDRLNVGYNLAMGFFTADNLDFKVNSGKDNDMYMQNSLFIGIDLF